MYHALGCLLQAVEALGEAAHEVGIVGEAGGLSSVDLFIKDVMEECVVDVKLMNRPVALGGKSEHRAHCRRFDNRAVCFPQSIPARCVNPRTTYRAL